MDEAGRALDTADQPPFDAEFAGLKARFDDQDQRSRELFTEQSKAADRVEAVVARIEGERRTTLLDIRKRPFVT